MIKLIDKSWFWNFIKTYWLVIIGLLLSICIIDLHLNSSGFIENIWAELAGILLGSAISIYLNLYAEQIKMRKSLRFGFSYMNIALRDLIIKILDVLLIFPLIQQQSNLAYLAPTDLPDFAPLFKSMSELLIDEESVSKWRAITSDNRTVSVSDIISNNYNVMEKSLNDISNSCSLIIPFTDDERFISSMLKYQTAKNDMETSVETYRRGFNATMLPEFSHLLAVCHVLSSYISDQNGYDKLIVQP